MNASHKLAGFVFVMLFLFSLSPALAQVDFTTDESQFLARNPNLAFQDFLGTAVAPGDVLICDSPVNSSSNDSCFTPGQILPGLEFRIDPPEPNSAELILVGSGFMGNDNPTNPLIANQFQSGLDILITAPDTNAVGITAGCLLEGSPCTPRNMLVSVFGANGLLSSTVLSVSDSFDSFLGITTNQPIVEIALVEENPDPNFQEGVLNVRFGTGAAPQIPTLSEWGMIAAAAGLGLIAVFFAVRRRRLQASA